MSAIVFIWCALIMTVAWICMVRNHQIFDARVKALTTTAAAAFKIIGGSWNKAYEILESYGSYEHMLFNVSVFDYTLDTLYPDIEKRLDELVENEKKKGAKGAVE